MATTVLPERRISTGGTARHTTERRTASGVVPLVERPRPHLYLAVFGGWIATVLWFHPRLASLMAMADSAAGTAALAFFIGFIELAWLYGFYNVGVVAFAIAHRRRRRPEPVGPALEGTPGVAMLYTTCNDFVEASAESCVAQRYAASHVYLLDDSSDAAYRERVDRFAERYPGRVTVVRRGDRRGFKAGNLNHGLEHWARTEPFFVLVDADEVLPEDFLERLVPRIVADPRCGFIQANHRCHPERRHPLADALGVGVDIHWRWYQPLRNRYGFVMLLGHGAIIRREAWVAAGGFPEIVSEDLGFAVRVREQGWQGHFAEDVVCYEDFPDTIRAFRIRHMKWTRGTSEFIRKELGRLIRSRRISWPEKLDILLPTLNLPLSLVWFLFLLDANLVLPLLFGAAHPVTIAWGGREMVLPTLALGREFQAVYSPDFLVVTLLTLVAPILCFVLDLWRHPVRLFRFLARSTAVYASLGPLSFLGVLMYAVTGRATFLVTGERGTATSGNGTAASGAWGRRLRGSLTGLLTRSHPDHLVIQGFEVAVGILLMVAGLLFVQLTTVGLGVAFVMMPVMHRLTWRHPAVVPMAYVPFTLIAAGVTLAMGSLVGIQTVMFGYGFHF